MVLPLKLKGLNCVLSGVCMPNIYTPPACNQIDVVLRSFFSLDLSSSSHLFIAFLFKSMHFVIHSDSSS